MSTYIAENAPARPFSSVTRRDGSPIVREDGTPTIYSRLHTSPVGFIKRLENSIPIPFLEKYATYSSSVTSCPITVATAAPRTSILGTGPSPNINTGSSTMLVMHPAARHTVGTIIFPSD